MKYFNKSVAIRVSDIYTYYLNKPSQFGADFQQLLEKVKEGILSPTIYKILPLEAVSEAHRLLKSGQVQGKLVLNVAE